MPDISSHQGPTDDRYWIRGPIPILLRPRINIIRNRLTRWGNASPADVATVVLTAVLMLGLYLCTLKTLQEWQRMSTGADVNPSALAGVCAGLFMVVFCSACVGGIGNLFLARDLDFVLSAPVSTRLLLLSRMSEIALSTIWMLVVFCVPLYLAYGVCYGAGITYYACAPIIMLTFLMLAVVGGVLTILLFCALMPLQLSRLLLVGVFLVALTATLSTVQLAPTSTALNVMTTSSSASIIMSLADHPLSPARWIAHALPPLVKGLSHYALLTCGLLVVLIACGWCALELAFQSLHARGYARMQSWGQTVRGPSIGRTPLRIPGFGTHGRPTLAIASREFTSFARDFTHTIQLSMLLLISVLYLYNLKGIEPPTRVGTTTLQVWDLCLLCASMGLSAMIILSICTRFVFPSVSLEGHAFWVLQSSPLSYREILAAKYRTWFLPIACMSTVVFASGGLALGVTPLILAALVAIGIIFAHSLVQSAIGFGARFARFDWGHSAEIATTWGSLAYTATGCILIAVSMCPLLLMFGVYILFPTQLQDSGWGLAVLSFGLLTLWLLHVYFGRLSARNGVRALEQLR
jgi:ABC-2 type transport system permease protein